MHIREEIAIGIGLQTQVLKICPLHNRLYCDEEHYSNDENMARAFAVAFELVKQLPSYAEEFPDAHVLTDLLSSTIAAAPESCPECAPRHAERVPVSDLSSEAGAFR